MGILRLAHVDVRTPDLELSTAYYTEVLGLRLAGRGDGTVYLKCWDEEDHHSIRLCYDPRTGLDLFSFRVEHPDDLAELENAVTRYGCQVQRVSRGEAVGQGESIRFGIPSGQTMELVYELDKTGGLLGKLNPAPVPPPGLVLLRPRGKPREDFATEIRIIRHGITQGYSTDAGLTPMGGWQSHQRGHSLSKSVPPGQKVRIVCADTSRARQTADQLYRGMLDGLRQWGREADISAPEPIGELRNFQVWTPEGPRDVTSAFRQYQALMEKLERMAVGDRPRWLVEIDRFYRNQLGGGSGAAA